MIIITLQANKYEVHFSKNARKEAYNIQQLKTVSL